MNNMVNELGITVNPGAVVQRFPVKKLFFKVSQNSQEITCIRVPFLIKLQLQIMNAFYSNVITPNLSELPNLAEPRILMTFN